MIVAASPARALAWAPLLGVAVLCNGLAAGVWKHARIDAAAFCVAYVIGKSVASGGLLAARGRRPLADAASRRFLGASLLAGLLNGVAWTAYLIAFLRGPLAVVQVVTAAYTAVAVVLAVLFLHEKLARAQAVGVALVVAAGALLGWSGETAASTGQGGAWVAATLAATGLWGASATVAKYAYGLPGADHPRFFVAQSLGLVVTLLPYGVSLAPGEPGGGGAALLVVVLLYVVADLGNYAALALGPASLVSPLAGLYPVPTLLYAGLVLGELPDAIGWAAIGLALPGILLAAPALGTRSLASGRGAISSSGQARSRGD